MQATNLSQLKKAIAGGAHWITVRHSVRPETIGLESYAAEIHNDFIYRKTTEQSDLNRYNCGRGCRMEYGKAADVVFLPDGEIEFYDNRGNGNRRFVFSIRLI